MITIHRTEAGRVVTEPWAPDRPLPPGTVWLDAMAPAEGELAALSAAVGVDLPTRAEMEEIEASSQLHFENDTAILTAPVVARSEEAHAETGPLTFVLTPRLLITLRYIEPRSMAAFADRLRRQPQHCRSPADAMLGLLDTLVDRTADVLEIVGARLEKLSRQVFGEDNATAKRRRQEAAELRLVLQALGRAGDLVGKVRDSLHGLDRIAAFLAAAPIVADARDSRERLKSASRDLRSLEQHADFQAQRVGFLLNATLGVIGAQQNEIIKIFSVVAVAFLPPTLIASIYGMNFRFMPELDWVVGYPLALLLMVISAILPLWYFRRRGWL